ncbi:MAG: hypothetical protein K2M77_02780, partial [Muribaculaceae bacterium]|nr:hypothetical protein [Muribaculaceae bacterium]
MNEYRIYRILKPIYSIIPPSFVITHEGLARCKSSLLRGIGLCRAELLFLQRFKPLHQRNIIEYEMLFESAEQPIIRLS